MYFTPDRLFMIAVVMTLICVDGVYRAYTQRQDGTIGPRLYAGYVTALVAGSGMTWIGFFVKWLA